MAYTNIMAILVNLGGWAFLYTDNPPSAIICFCCSIILMALHQIQKEIMQQIEKHITK